VRASTSFVTPRQNGKKTQAHRIEIAGAYKLIKIQAKIWLQKRHRRREYHMQEGLNEQKTSFLGYFTPPPLPLLSETGQKSKSPINYSNHFWEPPLHLLSQFFECKKLHTLDEKVINKRVILITAPIPHMIKIPSTSNMDSF